MLLSRLGVDETFSSTDRLWLAKLVSVSVFVALYSANFTTFFLTDGFTISEGKLIIVF